MKLNPEGVEKAARAICQEKCAFMGEPPCWDGAFMDEEFPPPACSEPGCLAEATAALTAYFDHLKEAGLMRGAAGINVHLRSVADWQAVTWANGGDFPALIFRTEARDDNA